MSNSAVPDPSGSPQPGDGRGEPPTGPLPPALPGADNPFPHAFGRYTLLCCLGTGGMATVYLASDSVLQREVALKIPHAALMARPMPRARFFREARAAARLRHPHLCPLFDFGEVGNIPYLTMPCIEGGSLSDWTETDPRAIVRLLRLVALAMAEAHRQNVIHRDLKPANILLTPQGEPVITDFGIALRLDANEPRTEQGLSMGSRGYAAPEQWLGQPDQVGPACDIYSLGAILYRQLTGHMPQTVPPEPPSQRRPGLDVRLYAICLRALAFAADDRFASMREFAAALEGCLDEPHTVPSLPAARVARSALRFAFVGMGARCPNQPAPQGWLYLDVGNDLRPGVLDHHHLVAGTGSTTSLVLAYPAFVTGAVRPGEPCTLVLHEKPDLDAVAAAFLASEYLATGAFPAGAEGLAQYADTIDAGESALSAEQPFSLYAAYMRLVDRAIAGGANSPQELWTKIVRAGLDLIAFTLSRAQAEGQPLAQVDAFACPGLFTGADRAAIAADLERYRRKLADPRCHARKVSLRLPALEGGTLGVPALLIRDVQNIDDPERCNFFKDWARSDGFAALCVFCSEGVRQARRAIISVPPGCGVHLRGMAAALDGAEAERRCRAYGVDDRVRDPATGEAKVPRPGYTNADPWYDGRAHHYTIVDAPRAGTLLTAEEIEAIFVRFGHVESASGS